MLLTANHNCYGLNGKIVTLAETIVHSGSNLFELVSPIARAGLEQSFAPNLSVVKQNVVINGSVGTGELFCSECLLWSPKWLLYESKLRRNN